MNFPDYFDDVPGITVFDPLAAFLGAPADGLLHYSFTDAVKLAGHACPTVASTWRCCIEALRLLYPDETPQRGDLRVELAAAEDEGVAGVIGAVAGLLTGAAGRGGFQGLAGRFARHQLLRFAAPGVSQLRLTRLDTGLAAECRINPATIPGDPAMAQLLPRLLKGIASTGEIAHFQALWQQRVARILLTPDSSELLQITLFPGRREQGPG